ncbi:hypothetical protein QVD17_09692 [Tagetes erecta]|uniref:Uncharacterized protein n=1 Tax=Tagetes erecta TaxID=13708 RepID=A0AAD8L6F9_TARER|nr:hypothetical protein QVD17_09692 [Tagetes erecta]
MEVAPLDRAKRRSNGDLGGLHLLNQNNVAKNFSTVDHVGRLYWGFPYSSTHSGMVINGLLNSKVNPYDHPSTHSQYNSIHRKEEIDSKTQVILHFWTNILLFWCKISNVVSNKSLEWKSQLHLKSLNKARSENTLAQVWFA